MKNNISLVFGLLRYMREVPFLLKGSMRRLAMGKGMKREPRYRLYSERGNA